MTGRFLEIDVLKVLGIVTVVWIHGMRPPWDPALSAAEVWIGHVTRFGVPAFLLASGFLYATTEPVPAATTRRRLRRVLVPYLLASAAAQLWGLAAGRPTPGPGVAADLLFGSSFGPYYYVPVVAVLIALTPLLARVPRAALGPLALLLVAAQWAVDAAVALPLPFYWHVRNPLLWWAYFALGWWLRLHYDATRSRIAPRRGPLALGLALAVAALTAGSAAGEPFLLVRSAAWANVYAILALAFVLACGGGHSPAWLRRASDATYAVYLFHLFFVYGAQHFVPPERGDAISILVPWLCGLAGSLAFVVMSQRLLGRRSRDWIGA